MYDVALTVTACLQAGTRADVAWVVEAEGIAVDDWSDAVVFTPGGGRVGSLGVFADKVADRAGRISGGKLVEVEVTEVDALIAELPGPGSGRCIITPADTLPPEVWRLAAAREPFCVVTTVEDGVVAGFAVYSEETIARADAEVSSALGDKRSGSSVSGDRIISVFVAVPHLVIVGGGPIVDALERVANEVGWRTRVAGAADTASGLIATLSPRDKVVVAAHDLELAGAGLDAALASNCGYIGSVGSRKMQEDRARWLAYRGVTDISRVRGPAGLDIGASTPGEVAVAVIAEAISESRDSP